MSWLDDKTKGLSFGLTEIAISAGIHLALIGGICACSALFHKEQETVIPIDLTFEAPADETPPPPPPVKSKTKKPEAPPKIDDAKTDAVIKIKDKPKDKTKPKPKEKPKPEEPKKSAKELREERLRRMRESAVENKTPPKPKEEAKPKPQPPVTGSGQKLDPDYKKFLQAGYKPGAVTVSATEQQRCVALIRNAFYSKWARPPWNSSLKEAILEIQLGDGGKISGYRLIKSSGDNVADRSVLTAASMVNSVVGLSSGFIEKNRTITVNFKVTPQ